MKQTITIALLLLMVFTIRAQAPQGFNYQAALRNNAGSPIASTNVLLRFSIMEASSAGNIVYQETHGTTSNAQGLVTAMIGKGSVVSGDFLAVDWANNTYFIKTEVNPGSGYVDMGTQQLISVPYALHADKARIADIAAEAEGLNPGVLIQVKQLSGGGALDGQILKYDFNKNEWIPSDMSLALNQLGGGTATNGQGLKWNGTSWIPTNMTTYIDGTGITISAGAINSTWTKTGNNVSNNNTGNIGINQSTPLAKLHVEGAASRKMAGMFSSNYSSSADTGTLAVYNGYTGNGFNTAITASVVGTSSYAAYLKSKWRGLESHVSGGTSGIGMAGVFSTDNTGNINYGVYSLGQGATTENYGTYGFASGAGTSVSYGAMGQASATGTATAFGVRGWADGTGPNYGVWGRALNGSSNYGVYCVGNGFYTGTWTNTSDQKLKTNIKPLTGSLDLVMKLTPSSYNFRTEDPRFKSMDLATGLHYGFIAQELEQVIPELVSDNVHKDPETKQTIEIKGVNYTEMIPILTKAIQEQNALVQQQAELIKALEARVKQLEGQQSTALVPTK